MVKRKREREGGTADASGHGSGWLVRKLKEEWWLSRITFTQKVRYRVQKNARFPVQNNGCDMTLQT